MGPLSRCASSTIQRRVKKFKKTFSAGRMRYGEIGKKLRIKSCERIQGIVHKAK